MQTFRTAVMAVPLLFMTTAAFGQTVGTTAVTTAGIGSDFLFLSETGTKGVQVPIGALLLLTLVGGWALSGRLKS